MKKFLTTNTLKYIAITAMIFDHIAMFFMSSNINPITCSIFRTIGRLTAAIMCYFIAEGFYYTHSKSKYALRLGVFALISQPAYTLAHHKTLATLNLLTDWNVIFTLLIGLCILCCHESISNSFLKWTSVVLLIALSSMGDWGIIAPIWILIFYIFRNDNKKKFGIFAFLAGLEVLSDISFMIYKYNCWYAELWQAGIFLVIPLLLMYNGKKGNNNEFHKWTFYIFYPLHLLLIGLIKLL
ncbi:MAG: TraX family protein [Clostridiaceae bacterium]|nr:TraX family protein [Clostridiaceae bacterium]